MESSPDLQQHPCIVQSPGQASVWARALAEHAFSVLMELPNLPVFKEVAVQIIWKRTGLRVRKLPPPLVQALVGKNRGSVLRRGEGVRKPCFVNSRHMALLYGVSQEQMPATCQRTAGAFLCLPTDRSLPRLWYQLKRSEKLLFDEHWAIVVGGIWHEP